jgi:hypothetical protein
LLFAGSETSVYVSFNDGDSWQLLQLNLPHTSMRDLAIHGDDLIVATHGRSFWILDDITPLRQLNEQIAKSPAFLFQPQEALRWRWNRNPDTPLPPETPAGKNPPDGAVIDYYLASAANGPVTLEIVDSTGATIRHYSSGDQPLPMEKIAAEHPIPMYWVRPARILSAAQGRHRFVWDLHGEPPKSLNKEFPISAIVHDTPLLPLGAWALPGTYTVRLMVDGKQFNQPLTLKMDPRIKTPLPDLQAQAALQAGAASGMNQSFDALSQVQSVRAQLKESLAKAKGKLADSLGDLDKQCAALAGATASTFFGTPPNGKQPENFSTLNQHFGQLLGMADSADAAPTTQAGKVYSELAKELDLLLKRWDDLKQNYVPKLSSDLQKGGFVAIDSAKPLDHEMSEAGGGDDEP